MDQFEEVDPDSLPSPTPDEEEEDTLTSAFVDKLTDRILQFQEVLVGHKLHEYQLPFARRMIRSVIVRDGEEITALASRQSGKTETVSSIMATMMILNTAPLTRDPSRWYFWRGWSVVLIVLALAFWGFMNVLGRQPAFPAGALDCRIDDRMA